MTKPFNAQPKVPEPPTFQINTFRLINSYSADWQTSKADPGRPLRAVIEMMPTKWDTGILTIAYDWRRLWTLKCIGQWQIEERRKQIETYGLTDEQKANKARWEKARAERTARRIGFRAPRKNGNHMAAS